MRPFNFSRFPEFCSEFHSFDWREREREREREERREKGRKEKGQPNLSYRIYFPSNRSVCLKFYPPFKCSLCCTNSRNYTSKGGEHQSHTQFAQRVDFFDFFLFKRA